MWYYMQVMTDIDKIKKIIEESGNNLHYQVVDCLRSKGWYVIVSPYYTDNFSEKPREIDIIAEKNFLIGNAFNNTFMGTINVQLFIECKYIKEDTVFWFDKKDNEKALAVVLSTTPLENPQSWSMTEKHHYLKNSLVAKLFASNQNRGQSQDGEVFYKAITQSLNGKISNERSGTFLPKIFNGLRNDKIQAFLKYPVIVCNSFDKLYKNDVTQKNEPSKINENFQFETQYAYFDLGKNQKNEFFLIDITCIELLDDYLKMLIDNDISAVKEKISWSN